MKHKHNLLYLFGSLLLAFFCLVFFFPKTIKAQSSSIRVSGLTNPRNIAPLQGFVPSWYFEEDPELGLRNALTNPSNFGPGGTVSCSVEFKPFVTTITPGSLIGNGQKKFEVFFAGLTHTDLTNEEANELAAFIRSGGIVFVSGGGYSTYQNLGLPGYDGSRFNSLFGSLGISDTFPQGEVVDFYPCGASTEPIATPVTTGPFGAIGVLWHDTYNPINTSTLQSVATGFNELCFIGMSLDPEGVSPLSVNGGQYYRTILAEGKFDKGYLSVSGIPQYSLSANYFLNLFSLACPGGTTRPPFAFLDLPWDYEGKGLSFSEAATAIGSYFDHEYPFGDVGSVLGEPVEAQGTLTNYEGKFRDSIMRYSSHDGYDWLSKAKVYNGDSVLAAGSGTATFFKADKNKGVWGTSACGNVIVIDHGNGYQTRYYHLQDNDPISQSFTTPRFVNKGEVIGKVGSTGTKSSAPHIHFSVIQDKNGDGNFNDNRPDGLTDPFGWQSKEVDPWQNYSFSYNGERVGNKSYYLWTKPIANLSKELTSNGGFYKLERYEVNFPQDSTSDPLNVSMQYSTKVTVSDSFESVGSALQFNVIDASGNPINTFPKDFTLTIDFKDFDINKYKLSSLSIYSSNDGMNWIKEDTNIDFASGIATSTLNHASYFALMGEKSDIIPPNTEALLTGNEGQTGWYRSDVEVTLNAEDGNEGSGIYYVGYKVDDDYFKEYKEPFTISDEGEHVVEFYSVDNDENIEELKSVTFHIDKTLPEARIEFSPEKNDAEILGVDEKETEVTFEEGKGRFKSDLIIIKDKSGNTLQLEGKFRRMDKLDTYSIESMQYNESEEFKFDKNFYSAGFALGKKSGEFNQVLQSWFDKGETLMAIIYNGKKDESEIFKKDKGEKVQWETKPGLSLLYIKTNNGNLEFGYE